MTNQRGLVYAYTLPGQPLLRPARWTETWNFWFVEALVEILLAMLPC